MSLKKTTLENCPAVFQNKTFPAFPTSTFAWRKGRKVMTGQCYDGRKMIRGGI